ncbi:dihydrolipoyl dehydrogenase [Alkalicoccobacillus porphyridii]|uniref:Dihydrolipoyl dehydrogenase n=1 Tax=Alkalicoccobacillus porphyridii TaxID=2597270 RepID=A0A554A0T0_9BACI|nr:dihydrolipoyl dehydrogenase [Alkalicoccobacillus porphyridii]TSB47246.1 dihydrolipoyl dehydrogenase [Alkalicoccobacillus porphyridii]
MSTYDIVVIGGGPGGYVAAIRAAKLGKKVAIIEHQQLGGTCLNRGCIPSKTLLRHAEVIEHIEQAKDWGIETGPVTFSLEKMLARKDQVIQKLRTGIGYLMKQGNIDVYDGIGEVDETNHVHIQLKSRESKVITANKIIVATGSSPFVPPIPGIESADYYTSDTVFDLTKIPKSIVIIGGGIIGVEFACIFSSLNVQVTVVEMGARIVPNEDEDAARLLAKALKKKGVRILTHTKVTEIEQGQTLKNISITSENGNEEVLASDDVLVCVGRKPNLSAISKLNLRLDGPFVQVDETMQTSHKDIYAVGDIIGGWQLAHAASAEGLVAAANAAGMKDSIHGKLVPRCVYTSPEIASVGLTEAEAKAKGYQVKVVKQDLSSNGKALAMDEATGFIKLIADEKYGEILGVTMAGPHVTEMIAEPTAFMHLEGTVEELASMIHAHPSVSEALNEAAGAWLGRGIHG